jgi:SAM-dependent methyltransferase
MPFNSLLRRVFESTEGLNRQVILGLVEPCPTGALLDCGCGDGVFTRQVAARAGIQSEVHGVEMHEPAAEAAERGGVHVKRADLNQGLPYPDARFEIVHANQVIEHLHDTDGFLREIRRVLRPGGTVLLSTNNLASWHNLVSLALGYQPMPTHASDEVILGNPLNPMRGERHPHPGRAHWRVFAWRGLLELVAHHGLPAERALGVGYYPLPPSLARAAGRIDPRHAAFLTFRLRRA